MTDKPAALLTPRQREYLTSRDDQLPSDDAERKIRSRIRKRVVASLSDLELAVTNLPDEDVEQIVSESDRTELEFAKSSLRTLNQRHQEQMIELASERTQEIDHLERRVETLEESLDMLGTVLRTETDDE